MKANRSDLTRNQVGDMVNAWDRIEKNFTKRYGSDLLNDKDYIKSKERVFQQIMDSFKGKDTNFAENAELKLLQARKDALTRQRYPITPFRLGRNVVLFAGNVVLGAAKIALNAVKGAVNLAGIGMQFVGAQVAARPANLNLAQANGKNIQTGQVAQQGTKLYQDFTPMAQHNTAQKNDTAQVQNAKANYAQKPGKRANQKRVMQPAAKRSKGVGVR
ncbi:hypothetical protein [[Flexibacter] sp. ATCC 35208]|uniref:hypothetical protein n=1 Tax=[Flexibacter] sp. ATCC 35208 TaxID=1936242 RepID=UPI0009CF2CB6|nr:hypothetical protein [[Flexibacter] sp. ATCC 35208]OMP80094.1 hypothetical protein BW716_06270 [[Flexibacter] sp. ATCC 35208]